MAAERKVMLPPWVEYPGYGPADMFWRQGGEPFFSVWKPYYESLSDAEKENYLAHLGVPQDWQDFYLDKDWSQWLASTDEEQ